MARTAEMAQPVLWRHSAGRQDERSTPFSLIDLTCSRPVSRGGLAGARSQQKVLFAQEMLELYFATGKGRQGAVEGPPRGARVVSAIQIACFERRAFPKAKPQPVAEIAFEIAVVGADGVEPGGEKRRLDPRQHLPDLLGKVGTGGGVAAVEAVGEQIVFRDQFIR